MNKVYMHFEDQKDSYLRTIQIVIVLLACCGVYKNGLSYFFQGKMTFVQALQPLVYPLLGVFACVISDSIMKKKVAVSLVSVMEGILLGIMMPPRLSILFYIVLLGIYAVMRIFLSSKTILISRLLVFKVVSILIAQCFLNLDYQNMIEVSYSYRYGILDTLIGRSVGGVGTTSIFLLVVAYFVQTTNFYYKKELPIYIIFTYSLLVFGYELLVPSGNLLLNLLNSHVYFMAIFLATLPGMSPAEAKPYFLYGVLIGVGCFIFQSIFRFSDGIYLSLFIAQMVWSSYCYFFQKRKAQALS